ncbi:hypothetical protein OH77DRAFT_1419525 [Trametes cingulata]|nr:hypothetical protein OH77DRAFT_1419525 [Trametes cingulata]
MEIIGEKEVPSDSQPTQITNFPREILVRILQQLKAADLLQCTKVCRAFRDVVGSCEVQYKLEVEYAGMEDGDDVETPITDRLQALRDYEDGWSTATFHRQPTSDPAAASANSASTHVRGISFLGSVIPTLVGTDLRLLRPSSPLRRIAERRWTIPLAELGIVPDFCSVDLSQDLVVVSGHRGDRSMACYLLSLNAGGRALGHPLARLSPYTYSRSYESVGETTMKASVHEDLVGWLIRETFVPDGSACTLMIYNWKTGTRILHIRPSPQLTFSFLGHCALAVGYEDEVDLYILCPSSHATDIQVAQRICTLRFPELSDPMNQLNIHALALQIPRTSRYDHGCLFRPDPESAVLAVDFGIYDMDADLVGTFALFVPLSSLLGLVDAYAPKVRPTTNEGAFAPSSSRDAWGSKDGDIRIFSWDAWAGKSARLVRFQHGHSFMSAFGSKCAMAFTGSLSDPCRVDTFVFDVRRWTHAPPSRCNRGDDGDLQHASQFFSCVDSSMVGGEADVFAGIAGTLTRSDLRIRVRHKHFECDNVISPFVAAAQSHWLALVEDGLAYMYLNPENAVDARGPTAHYSFSV